MSRAVVAAKRSASRHLLRSSVCPPPLQPLFPHSPSAYSTAMRRSALLSSSTAFPPSRRLSSFSGSEADEIFRDMQRLKKAEQSSTTSLVHPASSTSTSLTSSHSPPVVPPTGGPSVDAILRLRRTNRKVDADDVSSRFQKAMEYKRQKKQSKPTQAEERRGAEEQ